MENLNFPDQPRPGSTKPLATIDNVALLLKHNGIRARYNVIKKNVEIDIPDYRGTTDNRDNAAMTHVISLAEANRLPTKHVPEYVNAIADREAYNPVSDWIQSKPWDGEDRLKALYDTIITEDDYPEDLKRTLLRKWLLSAAAAALVPNYKGRGVLTLQGPQGIGKTSYVKALVSDPVLRDSVTKLDHHLDAHNKDSVLGAICNWIVEIGELESSFRKDVDRLKGFLTADSDRIRRPYDRREAEYQRRTVFVATVNGANFLTDPTGNTRWWTIAVKRLRFNHDIDMQQVFAQLAVQLSEGQRWWLNSDEEAKLEAWNLRHRTVSAIAEKLNDFLDLTIKDRTTFPSLSATEVLEAIGYERPTNGQCKECAAALRELLGEPKRIRGTYKWRAPLKEPDARSLAPGRRRQDVEDEEY